MMTWTKAAAAMDVVRRRRYPVCFKARANVMYWWIKYGKRKIVNLAWGFSPQLRSLSPQRWSRAGSARFPASQTTTRFCCLFRLESKNYVTQLTLVRWQTSHSALSLLYFIFYQLKCHPLITSLRFITCFRTSTLINFTWLKSPNSFHIHT